MAFLDDSALSAALKAAPPAGVYYLYGPEIYLTNAAAQRLIRRALGDADPDFNFQSFEGKGLSVSRLQDAVEALPVFAPRKCVAVHDLNADELNAAELDALLALLADVPDTTVLLLYVTGFELEAKRGKVSGKNGKVLAAVTKSGTVCEFAPRSTAELARFILDRATRSGCSITRANAEALSAACGGGLLQITNELDKLCAFANGAEIKASDIEALVAKRLDTNAFALARAVLQQNSRQAFAIVDELFYQRVEGIAIVGALAMAFVDLCRAKAAIAAGRTEGQVAADFHYRGREFAVKNAFRDVRRLSPAQLRDCMDALVRADERLKSSRADPRVVVEQTLVSMLLSGDTRKQA